MVRPVRVEVTAVEAVALWVTSLGGRGITLMELAAEIDGPAEELLVKRDSVSQSRCEDKRLDEAKEHLE